MKVFEWVENQITNMVTNMTKPVIDGFDHIGDHIKDGLIKWLLGMNPAGTDLLQDALKPLIDNPDFPKEQKAILKEWTSHTPPLIAALAPIIGALVAYPSVSAAFSGQLEEVRQWSFEKTRPSILNPAEIISAKRRGFIDAKFASQEFAWAGYDAQRQKLLDDVTTYYPTPQDFILFAVRDTFNPDVVKKYGYDDNYPEAINEQAAKAGMSSEWLHHYWRAHWQLPSPTQMYEMLHRDIITKQDAEAILRINDYAPYFVKPMLDISYNPYTRVDVGRMYDAGVLSREEVYRAYRDLGYDDLKASKLTEWVTAEGMAKERDLTQSQTLEAYNEGEILKSDAIASLEKLGYDKDESELILKLEDNKIERAYRKREKAIFTKQYIKGKITLEAFKTGLNTLQLTEREKTITLKEAALQVKENIEPL